MQHFKNIRIIDLIKYRFPITAITSILHRIFGVIIFLLLPCIIFFLHISLRSIQDFLYIKKYIITHTIVRLLLWIFFSSLSYHLIFGIKHLCMDINLIKSQKSIFIFSIIFFILSLIIFIILGIFLW